MIKKTIILTAVGILILTGLAACTPISVLPTTDPNPVSTAVLSPTSTVDPLTEPPESAATLPAAEPRLLTVCLGQEPRSLFIYSDRSRAAASVREALYDGPLDLHDYDYYPAIFAEKPSLTSGSIWFEQGQVSPGDLIIDNAGNFATLQEGIIFRPSGCSDPSCAVTYRGNSPVDMDRLVVRFQLLPELLWSDGTRLTAADSVYSYQIAQNLYPAFRPDLLDSTDSYKAVDETVLEWRGIPGYRVPRPETHYFSPLPHHAWGHLSPQELTTSEISGRAPLGWGPYTLVEWVLGDHITLRKNPLYFRSTDNLPHFDRLVFRFVKSAEETLQALAAGECDLADPTTMLVQNEPQMLELQQTGRLNIYQMLGGTWEQILLNTAPYERESAGFFNTQTMRQAMAMCIDRERLANELFSGMTIVPNSYLPPTHPLYNPEVQVYKFDPEGANMLLEANGWYDHDNNPDTPRIAQGASGFAAGATLEFNYLTSVEPIRQRAATIVKESLEKCGFGVNLISQEAFDLFASGPEGPVFGRKFDAAQFGWASPLEPACSLFRSDEVPGPYPDHKKGWGGANASGFNSPDFDAACMMALSSLAGQEPYLQAHHLAQKIYAEELPSIPLYLPVEITAVRSDFCGFSPDASAFSVFWNLEEFDYGQGCTSQDDE